MKLSVKGLMFASGIGWALIVLVLGVLNKIFAGYGEAYLTVLAAPFPWYEATGEIVDLIIGIVWTLVIGGICGIIFAWLYNAFAGKGKKKKAAPKRAAAKRPAPKKKAAAKKKPAAKKKKPAAKKKKPAAKKKAAAKKKKPAAKKKAASKKRPKKR